MRKVLFSIAIAGMVLAPVSASANTNSNKDSSLDVFFKCETQPNVLDLLLRGKWPFTCNF